MQHVDEGLLHAWLDGQADALGPARAGEVRRHLATCAECRTRLEEERAVHDRADALLRGGGPLGVEIPPFEALAARGVPARRPWRGPALAWAASLVLALGAGWLARSALRPAEPAGELRTRTAAAPAPPRPAAAPVSPPTLADAAREPEAVPAPRARVAAREEAPPAADLAGEAVSAPPPPAPPPPPSPQGSPEAPPAERTGAAAPAAAPAPLASGVAADAGPPARGDSARARKAFRAPPALEEVVVTGTDRSAGQRVVVRATESRPGGWLSVGSREARRVLGREPLRVRGLEVADIEAGRVEGREAVRVWQPLGGGALLSLVQVRDLPAASGAADSAPVPGPREDTSAVRTALSGRVAGVAVTPGPPAPADSRVRLLVRQLGGITVTASAPVPADSLARLLERLR